jgi:hypothetical protein
MARPKVITRKEWEELSKTIPLEPLEKTKYGSYIFALPGGKIAKINERPTIISAMQESAEVGCVYESREAFEAGQEELEAFLLKYGHEGPRHLLSDADICGRPEFIEQIDALIDSLVQLTGLSRKELDFSASSLRMLQKMVLERYQPEEIIRGRLYAAITAYLGECQRKASGGKWELHRDEEFDIWEPFVGTPSGDEYWPFTAVYDQLYDKAEEDACLEAAMPLPKS